MPTGQKVLFAVYLKDQVNVSICNGRNFCRYANMNIYLAFVALFWVNLLYAQLISIKAVRNSCGSGYFIDNESNQRGVKINDANVTTADVPAENGVVHVLDKLILESYLGINENNAFSFALFPNPSNGLVTFNGVDNAEVIVSDLIGKTFMNQTVNNNSSLDLSGLSNGTYLVTISQNGNQSVQTLVKF